MLLVFVANKAAGELAKVKSGITGGGTVPQELLWWFLLALAAVVALSTAITMIRRKKYLAIFRGLISISEPDRIIDILNRAVSRQALCSLEIFNSRHGSVYRGHLFEGQPGVQLILELSRLPGADVEFEGLPAQVNLTFRAGLKEDIEHYQFTSHTLALSLEKEKNWRVARVAVAWPKSIISAQRRDFLRIEPVGPHSLDNVPLYRVLDGKFKRPEDSRPLAEASVMDISVGGVQLILHGTIMIPENKESLLILDLPMTGLDLELKESRLYLLLSLLDIEVVAKAKAGSAGGERNTHTIVRGNFAGRYRLNPQSGQWDFIRFSPESFQDLSHWIYAYQRYLLKKESCSGSRPIERVNYYPPKPPARPKIINKD